MERFKILVVEDEGIVAADIKASLEDIGWTVTGITSSGEDALDMAEKNRPDLVLMDVVLKDEMDGIEAATKIHSQLDIPVVFLTAYTDKKTLERAKVAEPYGYIVKPFEEKDLHTTIEMAIYKHRMERRVKSSERWLFTTLNSIGDGVIATDHEGRVKFMNPAAEALTGWDMEEAVDRPLEEVFHIISETTGRRIEDPVAKVLKEGNVVGLGNHTLLISKTGKRIPIEDSAAPIKDDKGRTLGVVLVFLDITKQRRLRERIRRDYQLQKTLGSILRISLKAESLEEQLEEILKCIISIPWLSLENKGAIFLAKPGRESLLMVAQSGLPEATRTLCATIPFGRCICGRAASERRIIHTDHLDDRHEIRHEGMEPHGHYCVPVVSGDRLYGVLNLYLREGHKRDRLEERFLHAVGDVLAGIIEHRIEGERLERVKESILDFGPDPDENIKGLTALLGELLGADCALYNRLEGDRLHTIGRWNPPEDLEYTYEAKGHICYDVIEKCRDDIFVLRNLHEAKYVKTDPFVSRYGMRTYVGHGVKFAGNCVGSLCVVYSNDFLPGEGDKRLITIIASAIGVEENRRAAIGALKNSEAQHRGLVESTSDCICHLDLNGNIVYMNPGGLFLNGISSLKEVQGREFTINVKDEYRERLKDALKRARAGELVELEYQSKDGRWYSSNIGPIKDSKGDVASILKVSRDVTERKTYEEELRKLLRAVEQSPASITITDMEGNIEYVNPKFSEQTGYKKEEVIGKNPRILKSGKHSEEFYRELWNTIKSGREWRGEIVNKKKNGELYWEFASISPIRDPKGNITHFVKIGEDITSRKRMEEELQKMETLESIGILAGGIAHDFNNILTSVLGNIALAKTLVEKEEKVYKRLVEAENASIRARDLTQQLLTFAKGGMPVKETASITDIVKESTSFTLTGSNVRGEFSFPEDLWQADFDVGQISQVIQNMVINAVHAMPEGGVIKISGENVTVGREEGLPLKEGRYVKISIKDHGIGIKKEHLPRIFEPFFTTKQKGNGLGLATSYSIIKKHDGHITVESEPCAGTIFYIYLPASEKKVILSRKGGITIKGSGRVLVMDDEEMVREVAGEILRYLGYEVEFARDGEEAIGLYRDAMESGNPFDAVIMDLTIPGGMGGKEAIKRLYEIDPDVKAIVSSGYSNDPIMAEFKRYGFKGVVSKPYRIENLGEVLNRVIRD